ncbi:MAG TPA: hypothetical protein VF331_22320 [Polyangiales bacterium]
MDTDGVRSVWSSCHGLTFGVCELPLQFCVTCEPPSPVQCRCRVTDDARTDPELHAHLYEFERALGKAIGQVTEKLAAPAPEQRAAHHDQIELTLYMLRGMALQKILRRDDAQRRWLFEVRKKMVASALQS